MTPVWTRPEPGELAGPLLDWFAECGRDLPWRRPDAGAWAVLVSEFMLQQTPVARVLPTYDAWLARWPTATDLAGATSGEAVRMWGKLGYPRRAMRLHQCATIVRDHYEGSVPDDVDTLLTLPGIGAYTARAIAAFAFGRRVPVVDTNVRRVVSRSVVGQGESPPSPARTELDDMTMLLPPEPERAARMSAAIMELGALVCTARAPACEQCPLAGRCAWLLAGRPAYDGPRRRSQAFTGTDRQVRGLLLDVLRAVDAPVAKGALDAVWPDPVQRERALDSLVADGLVDPLPDATFALPS